MFSPPISVCLIIHLLLLFIHWFQSEECISDRFQLTTAFWNSLFPQSLIRLCDHITHLSKDFSYRFMYQNLVYMHNQFQRPIKKILIYQNPSPVLTLTHRPCVGAREENGVRMSIIIPSLTSSILSPLTNLMIWGNLTMNCLTVSASSQRGDPNPRMITRSNRGFGELGGRGPFDWNQHTWDSELKMRFQVDRIRILR